MGSGAVQVRRQAQGRWTLPCFLWLTDWLRLPALLLRADMDSLQLADAAQAAQKQQQEEEEAPPPPSQMPPAAPTT